MAPARFVQQHKVRPVISRKPAIPPADKSHWNGEKVQALFGEPVFGSRGAFLIFVPFQDVFGNQEVQSTCQNISRNSKVLLKSFEPADADERFPKHTEGPSVANDIERARY